MSGKLNLFDDNSDEDDGNLELTVNKDYAQRYEEWREAEIKRKLEDKYGNADETISSSSSEDEEDPEELKQVLSKDFFEVISSLKTEDPKIYNREVNFFKNEKEQSNLDPLESKRKKREGKEKPVYLRDYERKLITERGGELSDEDSDSERKVLEARSQSPSYVEEQLQLRESIKKALDENSDEENDLLIRKEKTKEEKQKEEEDYIDWLKGERESLPDAETVKSLKPLQNLWNDPKLDEGEKFLKDYILNKRFLEKDDQSLDADNLSEDEYQEEYMNQFERKYNFRYEEPDKEFLKRYPRTMEQSLRKKDTKRKEKREAVKQRKEEEKKRKKEELKVLKALKRKEILKKIEKIKAITGNDDLGINPDELEEDFDPEAHDRKMKQLFDDDYYHGAEDAEDEDELQLPPLEEELIDDYITWDDWDGADRNEKPQDQVDDQEGPYCEDPEFNMDCDYDPASASLHLEEKASERKSAREKRKLKRQSRFGRLVRKEKPVFDPKDKTFQQYVDEYYGMDYEDLIGDIPCRFKYKSVVPNSFGLTIEEILAADDKELNNWASIKKAYTIRPDHVEKNEAKQYALKAQNEELKRKILPSLYRQEISTHDDQEEGKKRKKKKKQKMNENSDSNDMDEEKYSNTIHESGLTTEVAEENVQINSNEKTKKKKKQRKEQITTATSSFNAEECTDPSTSASKEGKKKRKRKHSEENQNEIPGKVSKNEWEMKAEPDSVEVLGQIREIKVELDSYQDNNSVASKEMKKKRKKKHSVETRNEIPGKVSKEELGIKGESDSYQDTNTFITDKEKKKKFSKTSAKHNSERTNGGTDHTEVEIKTGRPATKKNKNNKKKNHEQVDGKNKKFKKWNQNEKTDVGLSDSRLKAYGIHPKKFRNRMKYGPQS